MCHCVVLSKKKTNFYVGFYSVFFTIAEPHFFLSSIFNCSLQQHAAQHTSSHIQKAQMQPKHFIHIR